MLKLTLTYPFEFFIYIVYLYSRIISIKPNNSFEADSAPNVQSDTNAPQSYIVTFTFKNNLTEAQVAIVMNCVKDAFGITNVDDVKLISVVKNDSMMNTADDIGDNNSTPANTS